MLKAVATVSNFSIGGVDMPPYTPRIETPQISIAIIEVTPAMAEAWLSRKTKNRNPRALQVDKIYRAITFKEFLLTHQGIAFRASDGALIDGQHRLEAIVRSGMSVTMVVAWNVTDDAMSVIDTGTSRRVHDVLTMLGVNNAKRRLSWMRLLSLICTSSTWALSVLEQERLMTWCGDALEWADSERGFSTGHVKLASAVVVTPCMISWVSHPQETESFVNKLMKREESNSSEAPAVLRELILNDSSFSTGGDGPRVASARRVFSALSAHLIGTPRLLIRPISIDAVKAQFMNEWFKAKGPWPLASIRSGAPASSDNK